MTDAQIDEWIRLAAEVGEDDRWESDADGHVWSEDGDSVCTAVSNVAHLATAKGRAAFIAASHSAVGPLVEEVRRLRDIVRDLAAGNPVTWGEFEHCALCGITAVKDNAEHAESCPWRRAREAGGGK